MKKIVSALALVPLAAACSQETTTRTIGYDFGTVSCSVEITKEQVDVDWDQVKEAIEAGTALVRIQASGVGVAAQITSLHTLCEDLLKMDWSQPSTDQSGG